MIRTRCAVGTALLGALAVIIGAGTGGASVLHVGADQTYTTIQDAIAAAVDNDEIIVHPGTYSGPVDYGDKVLAIHSTNPTDPATAAGTTIVGEESSEPVVTIGPYMVGGHRGAARTGEIYPLALDGFTITGGTTATGGGVLARNGTMAIRYNRIQGNTAAYSGGGIYCDNCTGTMLEGNVITGNTAGGDGGGIACYLSSVVLLGNFISQNTACQGGGLALVSSTAALRGVVISANTAATTSPGMLAALPRSRAAGLIGGQAGGGVTTAGSRPLTAALGGGLYMGTYSQATAENCTLSHNTATTGGGTYSETNATLTLHNSIVTFGTAGGGVATDGGGSPPTVSYCNVHGNTGGDYVGFTPTREGLISVDPLFANAAGGDFHLKSRRARWSPSLAQWVTDAVHSPCIDRGDPASDCSQEAAPNGCRVNLGAFGGAKEASQSVPPDLSIATDAVGSYLGNDLYNGDATGQTRSQTTGTGRPATYFIKLENDSPYPQSWTFTLGARARGAAKSAAARDRRVGTSSRTDPWGLRVVEQDTSVDITTAVTGTGQTYTDIASGATVVVRVEITPDAAAPPGAVGNHVFVASQVDDANNRDVVQTSTTRAPLAERTNLLAVGEKGRIIVVDPATGNSEVLTTAAEWALGWWPDVMDVLGIDPTTHFCRIDPTGLLTALFGSAPGRPWGADVSPAGSRLACHWGGPTGNQLGIWTTHLDGQNAQRVVSGADCEHPRWSPDGTKLAYHRSGVGEVYVVNANGSDDHAVTAGVTSNGTAWFSSNPEWSPDGQWLYFMAGYPQSGTGQAAQIFRIAATARGSSVATQLTTLPGHNRFPAVSPDGAQVAFQHGATDWSDANELWVIDADGGNRHRIYTCPPDFRTGLYGGELGRMAWSRRPLGLPHRPDLLIWDKAQNMFLGDGAYNTDGTNQTSADTAVPGAPAVYRLRLQNDGTATDTFVVRGPAGGNGWTVRYFDAPAPGGQDITHAMTTGGWQPGPVTGAARGGELDFRAEVVPDSTVPPGTVQQIAVTVASLSDNSLTDTVVAVTTAAPYYRPDLTIQTPDDANPTGDGVYGIDGTNQTRTQTVPARSPATYSLQLQNDGNTADSFRLLAPVAPAGWTVTYNYLHPTQGAIDITGAVNAGVWDSGTLAPGNMRNLRIDVTPSAAVAPETVLALLVSATSTTAPATTDAAQAVTTASAACQPDLVIEDTGGVAGRGTYNTDAAGQERAQTVTPGTPATYQVTIYNDGSVPDSFTLTGDAGETGWTVRYYDAPAPGGTDITVAITSGNWSTGDLAVGASRVLRVVATADPAVAGAAVKPVLIAAVSDTDATKRDAVRARTSAPRNTQPDMLVRNAGETDWAGDGRYNTDGTDQTRSQTVDGQPTAVYEFQAVNDGNVPQSLRLTAVIGDVLAAAATGPGWTVTFYDALTGGSDITAELTGTGRVVGPLSPGAGAQFRAEVRFEAAIAGNSTQRIHVSARSELDTTQSDTALISTAKQAARQPDLLVRNRPDTSYEGRGTYNTDGARQQVAQTVGSGVTAVYEVQALNAGNVRDTFALTAGEVTPAQAAAGWTIRYFDALAGGTDITGAVTGEGWSTATLEPGATCDLRIEVTCDATVAAAAVRQLLLTARSVGDATRADAVGARTTKLWVSRPDLLIRNLADADYLGGGTTNATGQDQTAAQIVAGDTTATYPVRLENRGNSDEAFRITGVIGAVATGSITDQGWTVAYFDALTGGTDRSALVANEGYVTPVVPAGGALELRIEVKPGSAVAGKASRPVLLTATSTVDLAQADTVKAATSKVGYQPDGLIRAPEDSDYLGSGTYNTDAAGQTRSQSKALAVPAVAYVRVRNDANVSDRLKVTSPGLDTTTVESAGWRLAAFNAFTGGSEITTDLLGAGWMVGPLAPGEVAELRLELTAVSAQALVASARVPVTIASRTDAARRDTVAALATLLPPEPFARDCATGLWMVGCPGRPLNPSADAVFGTADIARWNAATQAYQLFATSPFDAVPGQGYWVRYTTDHPYSFDGYELVDPVVCAVLRGWNLLANAWTTELQWASVSASGNVEPYAWVQNADGTGYELVWSLAGPNTHTTIPSGKGFWLKANENCTVTLGVATGAATPALTRDAVAWLAPIGLRTAQAVDESNYIGMTRTAAPLTVANPPQPARGYADLYVVDSGGGHSAVSLAAADAVMSWELIAETDLPRTQVQVVFPDLSAVPANLALVLKDRDAGRSVNMRTTQSYSFVTGAQGAKRRLCIEATPRGTQPAILTSVAAQPAVRGLQVTYTLSAAAQVDVVVMNIAGRPVARVASGRQEAGTHTAVWSGQSLSGTRVPAGRYLVQVRSAAEDGTACTRVVAAAVR